MGPAGMNTDREARRCVLDGFRDLARRRARGLDDDDLGRACEDLGGTRPGARLARDHVVDQDRELARRVRRELRDLIAFAHHLAGLLFNSGLNQPKLVDDLASQLGLRLSGAAFVSFISGINVRGCGVLSPWF